MSTQEVKRLTHKECVEYAYSWILNKVDVAMPEFFCFNDELPDVIGFRTGGNSIVIECKVSRGDFLKDKYKIFRKFPSKGMGNLRYYCCPRDLIKPYELPDSWGLIYIYPSGYVKRVKEAKHQERNIKAEHHMLFYYARRATYANVHNAILEIRSGL